ncbi:MAG: hypothetical protein ACJ73S_03990 [Mycobacteriales bacterium]|jgi:hypothetical protein
MSVRYESASELAAALRRAAEAHGRHEEELGREDPDWPAWYAGYMEREQAGQQAEPGRRSPPTVTVKGLPDRVDPKDLVASQATEPPPDPEGGRDTETDFLLRYGAGGDG